MAYLIIGIVPLDRERFFVEDAPVLSSAESLCDLQTDPFDPFDH